MNQKLELKITDINMEKCTFNRKEGSEALRKEEENTLSLIEVIR
jgi:hypothetical protein